MANVLDWSVPFKSDGVAQGWPGRLAAFWECCSIAVYSLTGNEVIAVLCVETEQQRRNLPKAVRRIPRRIVSYYVLAVFGLGLSVSSTDPLLALPTSNGPVRNYPGGFVIMAERAGIPLLPDLINGVMIIAAFSMATAGLFVAVLYLIASLN
jgi:amino acid transporter